MKCLRNIERSDRKSWKSSAMFVLILLPSLSNRSWVHSQSLKYIPLSSPAGGKRSSWKEEGATFLFLVDQMVLKYYYSCCQSCHLLLHLKCFCEGVREMNAIKEGSGSESFAIYMWEDYKGEKRAVSNCTLIAVAPWAWSSFPTSTWASQDLFPLQFFSSLLYCGFHLSP